MNSIVDRVIAIVKKKYEKFFLFSELLLKYGSYFLLLIVVCLSLFTIHHFFLYIDKTPYLAVDDALGNVSYTIATEKRFAFPASPTVSTGKKWGHRMQGLLTYGPWYFYMGAGLIWLFGFSVSALRFIHLLVVLFLIFMAFKWYKGSIGRTAAGIFAILLLHCFNTVHWPMIRPDSAVSLFAILFVVFSGCAIRDKKSVLWLPAGFCAACATFTHLIAWAMIPVCGFVFASTQYDNWKNISYRRGLGKKVAWDLAMVVAGGLLGALIYYGSLGFRFQDHLNIVMNYSSFVDDQGTGIQYFSTLEKHFRAAFMPLRYSSVLKWVFAILFLTAPCILTFGVSKGWINRRENLSFLVPPYLVFFGYLLTLGTYKNYHSGYSILLQVSAFWCIAAVLFLLIKLIKYRSRISTNLICVAIIFVTILLAIQTANKIATAVDWKLKKAEENVSISQYYEEIINLLPASAKAWGTVLYGMESPGRIQLMQLKDGYKLTKNVKQEIRDKLAPDYFVLGYVENRDNLLSVLHGGMTSMKFVQMPFPGNRFHLVSLVAGPPYGVTRVYQRMNGSISKEISLPAVSIYAPENKQWGRAAGEAYDAAIEEASPARFKIGYSSSVPWTKADRTVKIKLHQGWYVLKVHLKSGSDQFRKGMMVVLTTQLDTSQVIPETGPDFDAAPYFPKDKSVYLVHRHKGGNAFISLFDADQEVDIAKVEVIPIVFFTDYSKISASEKRALPPLKSWHVCQNGQTELGEGGAFLIKGDTSQLGYQLWSPPIKVNEHSTIILELPVYAKKGAIGVGILSQGDLKWIISPVDIKNQYIFETGKNKEISVVIANNRLEHSKPVQSTFVVNEGFLTSSDHNRKWYSDMLINANKGIRYKSTP